MMASVTSDRVQQMILFSKVFSTRTLFVIACFLGEILFMKGLGAYYDFNWATALAAQ